MRKHCVFKLLHFVLIALIVFLMTGCEGYFVGTTPVFAVYKDDDVAALAVAAAQGDEAEIKRLIKEEGVDPNAVGEDSYPLLAWPAAAGNLEGFRALIRHGADPNYAPQGGSSLMDLLVGMEDDRFLSAALEMGANPHLENKLNKSTPMFSAIQADMPENIPILLEYGADIHHKNAANQTPLTLAATLAQWEAVYYLLKNGAYTPATGKNHSLPSWFKESRPPHEESEMHFWYQKVSQLLQ